MGARRREERYAASAIASFRAHRVHHTMRALPMYRAMIIEGAWWDLVDELAGRLGEILRRSPAPMARRMRIWAKDDDLWIRRSAILCQLGFKEHGDRALLHDCIEASMERPEFFLRKAIGWAIRDVAWHDPDWAIAYVSEHAGRLSTLSKREGLKNLLKSGAVSAIP